MLDARRGKLFSKLSKEITVAAKIGGGDPNFNPRLRQAISAARDESMPADNIDRAIKKGTGELEGGNIEEMIYEGYGPGGVAIMVESATDNKNRTAAEIRSIFSKNGGNLAGPGSVAWMFSRKGQIVVDKAKASEDDVFMVALDAGADDVKSDDATIEVVTPVDKFEAVAEALKKSGLEPASAKLTYLPANQTQITDSAMAEQVIKLCEALDDHDDVQNVHSNFDIAPELIPSNQ